ncbi:MAG: PorP/SprF family type IX secretion system membrane protein [Bacteroidia bacterium]|nr:PorP/SprF family type IX secretion system membrane protein [Bacteroidia bacterium]
MKNSTNNFKYRIFSMKCRMFFILHFLFYILHSTFCQEIHFSQFYSSPFTLNPALTGSFDGTIRAGLNYKTQWSSVTTPYETAVVYGDCKWHYKALATGNWFGIGGMIFNDRAGDGNLSATRGILSIALHKSFDRLRNTYLSMGFSGGVGQKSIRFSRLLWGNQWNGTMFDNVINSEENYTDDSFIYFDMNTGIIFSALIFRNINCYAGGALNHVAKHRESFYGSRNAKEMKAIVNAGAIIDYRKKFVVEPAVFLTGQRTAKEIIIGSNIAFKVLNEALYTGVWYRLSGDITPVAGFLYNNFRVLLSYDYNFSRLYPVSGAKGGFEISIVYIVSEKDKSSKKSIIKCPSFYNFESGF